MPDEIDDFLSGGGAEPTRQRDEIDDFLGTGDIAPRPTRKPVEPEPPKPSTLEQWVGKDSFIGTLGDTAGRIGSGALNLVSAAGNLAVGDTTDAYNRAKSAVQGLPGVVGGAVDLVGGRLGAPSLREPIDELAGFDESDRMHGQKLMKEAGIISRDDNPLLSLPGALGLGVDIVGDPTTYASGGLTKAGQAAKKVSGWKKFAKTTGNALDEAKATNNAPRVQQLSKTLNTDFEIPTGAELAPTKAAQVDAGQRALLSIGDTPIVKGKAVYKAVDKVGEFLGELPGAKGLKSAFHHGPIEEIAANTERTQKAAEAEFHKTRQRLAELKDAKDPAVRASIKADVEKFYDKWVPHASVTGKQFAEGADKTFSPMAQKSERAILNALEASGKTPTEANDYVQGLRDMFDQYTNIEKNLSSNVGSDTLQMTVENKKWLNKWDNDKNMFGAIVEKINEKLLPTGKTIDTVGGLKKTMDNARRDHGMTTEQLNSILDSVGAKREPSFWSKIGLADKPVGNNFFPEASEDIMYMRGAQYLRSQGVQDYVDGLRQHKFLNEAPSTTHAFPARLGDRMHGKTYYFETQEMAKRAEQVLDLMIHPERVSEAMRYVDKANGMMKAGVTRLFPEFHIRNTISNKMQSSLEGVPVFGEHRSQAADIMAGKNTVIKVGEKTFDRDTIMDLFTQSGGSKGGFWDAALIDAAPIGAKPSKIKQALDVGEKVMASPAGAGLIARNPKMAGHVTGQLVEDTDRLAHWLYMFKQGADPVSATQSVDRALFNYSKAAMTPFEQEYMNRAILFYGYTRSVIPFMIDKAITEPGRVSAFLKVGESGGKAKDQPAYLDDQQTIGLPQDMKGLLGGPPSENTVGTSLPTPLGAAIEPISDWDKGPVGFLKGLASKASPVAKLPLELISGKKTFTDQPYTNKPPKLLEKLGVDAVAPTTNTLLENLPTSRGMRTVGQDLSWDLLTKMSGVGTSRFEPTSQNWFNKQAELKPQLEKFYAQGWVARSNNRYTTTPEGKKIPGVGKIVELYNTYGLNGVKAKKSAKP
jgi:hypothetical protein